MAGNEYYPTRPHEAQDRTRIAAGSPLAVLGIFLEALRERFAEGNGLPYVWRPDVQTTDILIEAGYNVETEARDTGVAIYVNRLNTVPQSIAIGDRVGVHLPDHYEGFTCMMASTISIDCVANDQGHSALLADIVQHFLMAGKQIFEGYYGLHDVSLAAMEQTLPFSHDQEKFSTTVTFGVQYQARWSTVKIRPLLQGISIRPIDGSTVAALEVAALSSLERESALVRTPAPSEPLELAQISTELYDPHPATPGLRTLGYGPRQALPGSVDFSRFPRFERLDTLGTYRPALLVVTGPAATVPGNIDRVVVTYAAGPCALTFGGPTEFPVNALCTIQKANASTFGITVVADALTHVQEAAAGVPVLIPGSTTPGGVGTRDGRFEVLRLDSTNLRLA